MVTSYMYRTYASLGTDPSINCSAYIIIIIMMQSLGSIYNIVVVVDYLVIVNYPVYVNTCRYMYMHSYGKINYYTLS